MSMDSKFSPRIKDVLSYSREEAIRLGNDHIGTEHLFLGILRDGEGVAIDIMTQLGIDFSGIKKDVEKAVINDKPLEPDASVPLMKSTEKVLKIVYLEARSLNEQTISTGHLLLAILKDQNSLVSQLFNDYGLGYDDVKTELEHLSKTKNKSDFPEDSDDQDDMYGGRGSGSGQGGSGSTKGSSPKTETPVLDNFGIDITKAAVEGSLDPIVGRQKEIERIAQVLSRRKKNNPVLIGEPGVGKSALWKVWLCVSHRKKFRACCLTNV